jgi:hypothetical protein
MHLETSNVPRQGRVPQNSANFSKAYANMAEKMHENNNVLDHIFGVVFLGTPHMEDASRLDINVVESIVRAGAAPFSFLSFTQEDNQSIAQISRGFSGFGGQVVSTFETIESKYRGVKLKGEFLRTRLVECSIPPDVSC